LKSKKNTKKEEYLKIALFRYASPMPFAEKEGGGLSKNQRKAAKVVHGKIEGKGKEEKLRTCARPGPNKASTAAIGMEEEILGRAESKTIYEALLGPELRRKKEGTWDQGGKRRNHLRKKREKRDAPFS